VTFNVLCRTSQVLEGELKEFAVKGIAILVINNKGHFYCLDARCTHAGAPLAEGELIGNLLKCPWHGSQYNIVNGMVVKGPAQKQLRVFNCVIKDDLLLVEI
jgi:nitrite reductase/ring-hydroxylating ferredoxin subunit